MSVRIVYATQGRARVVVMRRATLGTFTLLVALLAADALVKKTDLVGGAAFWMWCVVILSGGYWLLTAESIRRRRYTIHVQPRGSGWSLFVQRPELSSRGKKALKKRAEAASRAILELVAECRRTDPTRDPWWYGQPNWDNMSDEEKSRIFNEHGSKSSAHTTEYMSRYLIEHSAEAMALFEEFKERDMTDESQGWRFEHPTNPLGLEEVGRLLGTWARRL